MGNYQHIGTKKPADIENRKAYLIGGGIASLSAAAFLMMDGHMDGKNITIFEKSEFIGGSLDGGGNAKDGYIIRGGREMEEHFECAWDLFSRIPSLTDPERTVLDEFRELNIWDPNVSACRVIQNCGEKANLNSLGLDKESIKMVRKLLLVTENELGAKTVKEYFNPSFFETNMWCFWRSMFAFEDWHSIVEMKRYFERFIHLMPGMSKLKDILFSKYNQYDSFILPLKNWLTDRDVNFVYNAQAQSLDFDIIGDRKTVTAIRLSRAGAEESIPVDKKDLVFVTLGSMTENSTLGSMNEAPALNRGEGACWNLWKNIAKKHSDFGKPEVFCSDIDKSKWESFTVTCTDSPIAEFLQKLTGRDPYSGRAVTGGIITIRDSSWLMSVTCSRQPHFINQPKNVLVLWAYGLFPDNVGDFVKKKMSDCTGAELMTELLYHLGLKDRIPEILKTVNVIPCMMPYITSQFMPRLPGDRPAVVPKGSANLAFMGQYVEQPGDCVFTVEYSVRAAQMAVYQLLDIKKEIPKINRYDLSIKTKLQSVAKSFAPGKGVPAHQKKIKCLRRVKIVGALALAAWIAKKLLDK